MIPRSKTHRISEKHNPAPRQYRPPHSPSHLPSQSNTASNYPSSQPRQPPPPRNHGPVKRAISDHPPTHKPTPTHKTTQQGDPSMTKRSARDQPKNDISDNEVAELIAKAKARAAQEKLAEERATKIRANVEKQRVADVIAEQKQEDLERKAQEVRVPKPSVKPSNLDKDPKQRAAIPRRPADTAPPLDDDEVDQMIAKAKARRLAEESSLGATNPASPPPSTPRSSPPRSSPPKPKSRAPSIGPYEENTFDPEAAHQARLARLRAAKERANATPSPEPLMEKEPEKKRHPLRYKSPPPDNGQGGRGRR
ncbi:hypothetical protein GLAREA_09702 [Glarea lozoyensis ATCC 20868]|uniref:Uncharacterized protein n=1 Tax=Glarea lozoyensis (strain ATCC 20868 / MF5171) TaxID=1116229 RepID=S3D9A6_GLAL2|nr:uncharacterized protein GLAREA_09702 [Glarea lozoyensis ATCC 20868]EPE28581.1 hypothetical protein GLAREA_09702 [Glarea lozoyensis ATCC 20868]